MEFQAASRLTILRRRDFFIEYWEVYLELDYCDFELGQGKVVWGKDGWRYCAGRHIFKKVRCVLLRFDYLQNCRL